MEIGISIALLILGALLIVVAFIGCVLPALPGPPFAFISLLILEFSGLHDFATFWLITFGILSLGILTLDYLVPIIGTKKFGGSKNGMIGSTIGLILGLLFFPPLGIIIGPFAGAVTGELIGGKEFQGAIKAGFGALLGFLVGTFAKLLVTTIIASFFIYGTIGAFAQIF